MIKKNRITPEEIEAYNRFLDTIGSRFGTSGIHAANFITEYGIPATLELIQMVAEQGQAAQPIGCPFVAQHWAAYQKRLQATIKAIRHDADNLARKHKAFHKRSENSACH